MSEADIPVSAEPAAAPAGEATAADPTQMRAVIFDEFGDPDVLKERIVTRPVPGPGEVRVRVHAAFVAFGRDVSTRSGEHPVFRRLVSLPHILGGECAGVVDATGPDGSDQTMIGRRVAVSAPVACTRCSACRAWEPWNCVAVTAVGIQRPGSYAEYIVVPAANIQEIPAELRYEHAAAFAASGPLAWEQLDIASVVPGEWVFIPGASGSVGMLLVSLAKRRGAYVVAATRGARAATELAALGADELLDSNDATLAEKLRTLSPSGIQVVIDNVTEPGLWARYWPAVAKYGRVVTAGQASSHGEPLPLDVVSFYNRRVTFTGLTIGDPRPIRAFWADQRRSVLSVDPALVATWPLADAAGAHRHIEQGSKIGHVVLTS